MLTIKEAAATLGVNENASKAEVNTAYREAISKYHPDANRTKPEAERKRAEEMFKKVGEARKVMLNPSLAAPDDDAEQEDYYSATSSTSASEGDASGGSYRAPYNSYNTRSASTRTGRQARGGTSAPAQGQRGAGDGQAPSYTSASGDGYAQVQGKQGRQSYQASASKSQFFPQGHNTSHSFNDNVPRAIDPAEESLADIYREETRGDYLSFSDKARITPSDGISLVFLIFALAIAVTSSLAPFDVMRLDNPAFVFALVCLAKIAIYDTFISYYAYKAIRKVIEKGAWATLCGIEGAIMSVAGLALLGGTMFVGIFEGLVTPILIFALVCSVIAGAAPVVSEKLAKGQSPRRKAKSARRR